MIDEARECETKSEPDEFLGLGLPFDHSLLRSLTLPLHLRYHIRDPVSHVLRARISHRSGA